MGRRERASTQRRLVADPRPGVPQKGENDVSYGISQKNHNPGLQMRERKYL